MSFIIVLVGIFILLVVGYVIYLAVTNKSENDLKEEKERQFDSVNLKRDLAGLDNKIVKTEVETDVVNRRNDAIKETLNTERNKDEDFVESGLEGEDSVWNSDSSVRVRSSETVRDK